MALVRARSPVRTKTVLNCMVKSVSLKRNGSFEGSTVVTCE